MQRLRRPCVARAAVYNLHIPSVRVIHGTVTSPRRPHHVSRAFLTWPSCCAIPGDITRTRTALRSLPRRRNRLCHHRDVLREQYSWPTARRPLHTCFPNSHNRHHFSRPRGGFVPITGRFNAGSQSRSLARLDRSQNKERTSHAAFHGAGAVSKITLSITRPTSPVCRSVSHFLTCHVICILHTF